MYLDRHGRFRLPADVCMWLDSSRLPDGFVVVPNELVEKFLPGWTADMERHGGILIATPNGLVELEKQAARTS